MMIFSLSSYDGGIMNRQNKEQGSSLIEVIMAMVIGALLLSGLNSSLVALINSNFYSKEISVATASGSAQLERFRASDYGSIITGSDYVHDNYCRSWTVTDDGMKKKVDLTVSWPKTAVKHMIALSTIIAKP
jgi:prepilin-type N-terminal cleavage/methylation domain-containing protein